MHMFIQSVLFLIALTSAAPVNNTTPLDSHGVANRGLPGPLTLNIQNRLPGAPPLLISVANDAESLAPFNLATSFTKSTSIGLPYGWAGEFTIGKASAGPLNSDGSRIEGNWGYKDPDQKLFLDVSYVVGYSVPITCSCANVVVTGCNIDLFARGTCPPQQRQEGGVCLNTAPDTGPVEPFFAPCCGAAYMFSTDDKSVVGCPAGTNIIDCCVGSGCPALVRQMH